MTKNGDLPVIITPHAAFKNLTLKGTLNTGYQYSIINGFFHKALQRRVDNASMEIDFDVLVDKCSSSKLRPSFRVVSMIVSNHNTARLRVTDMFQHVGTEPLHLLIAASFKSGLVVVMSEYVLETSA